MRLGWLRRQLRQLPAPPRVPTRIVLVGDSTVATVSSPPPCGWGQVFDDFFVELVTVVNHAVSGRSSKSFIEEGRWQAALADVRAGGYVFIQFGHNDEKLDERHTEASGMRVAPRSARARPTGRTSPWLGRG